MFGLYFTFGFKVVPVDMNYSVSINNTVLLGGIHVVVKKYMYIFDKKA